MWPMIRRQRACQADHTMHILIRHLLYLLLLALSGCSSVRPWVNEPLSAAELQSRTAPRPRHDPSLLVAVTLSGGGARAAAFGFGVLTQMQKTALEWNGKHTNLLAETDMVSGVSGGSIVAAYLAVFGSEGLARFEQDFLRQDFQDNLISLALKPANLVALTSPWFGRTHLLAQRLDHLYQGATYGDLSHRPNRPQLVITATDMSLGTGFEFSRSQFDLICSRFGNVPIAFAVAASSAVPLLLSPVTLHNYSATCPRVASGARMAASGDGDYRARMMRAQERSYLDGAARPYIHLVDGGLSDNLGVRRALDQILGAGGLRDSMREYGYARGSIRKLVLISVNSERDPSDNIDTSDRLPANAQVIDTLLFGTGARATKETQEFLADITRQWQAELSAPGEAGFDAFAPNAEVHVIQVNLRDTPSELGRRTLLQVPTAFSITPGEVTQLIDAGSATLRESPEFQQLLRSLAAPQ